MASESHQPHLDTASSMARKSWAHQRELIEHTTTAATVTTSTVAASTVAASTVTASDGTASDGTASTATASDGQQVAQGSVRLFMAQPCGAGAERGARGRAASGGRRPLKQRAIIGRGLARRGEQQRAQVGPAATLW